MQQAAAATEIPAAQSESAEPGVEVENEPLFADETEAAPEPVAEEAAPVPAPAPTRAAPAATEPSLVSQAVGWLTVAACSVIGVGVAAVLLTALWFVRRRRQESEDVTGRWEALESETDDDRNARPRPSACAGNCPRKRSSSRSSTPRACVRHPSPRRPLAAPLRRGRSVAAVPADETLSSQTVINLDQADAVAEADFHIAYGLYDQAAELVQKALEAAPDRRDLKLKLLEVYFMWGNKDAFLKAAQALRADVGQADDPDWNKVVIMGRQICPDERLFTEATTGGGAGASTSISRPAIRRSTSRSTTRRPRWRPRLTSGSI